jgi:small-conductance mechanosensitive channel
MPMLAMIQSFDDMLGALGLDSAELVRVLLRIFMIWALAWIGFRVVRLVSKRIVARVDDRDDKTLTLREKRGQTIAQLVQGVGRVLILFIAILLTSTSSSTSDRCSREQESLAWPSPSAPRAW